MKNILVIAAHPDDEVLGCGATIARFAKEGNNIFIAILGEGITSRYTKREDADPKLIDQLKAKAQKAAKLMGAQEITLFDFPDNRFDSVDLLDIVKTVESVIDKTEPDIIFTHHAHDLNMDHALTHRATLIAARPIKGRSVREIYAFEVPSSTDWAFGEFGAYKPNMFCDVEDTIEIKTEAMKCYDTEARAFPHPRSSEAISAAARKWGSTIGAAYAESFETVRRLI